MISLSGDRKTAAYKHPIDPRNLFTMSDSDSDQVQGMVPRLDSAVCMYIIEQKKSIATSRLIQIYIIKLRMRREERQQQGSKNVGRVGIKGKFIC